MRVFVTGATGFVGSAIVQELLGAGHQVLGLARSDANAKALTAAGAEVHRGDLEDLESLRTGAKAADGVIHAGFIHDFTRFREVCEVDRIVIETLGKVYEGSDRPLIITSGIGVLNGGHLLTEDEIVKDGPNPRIASEYAAMALAERGVRATILRLPPSVHGDGDHGFIHMLAGIARQNGESVYTGEGQNRWPAVHRLDAARLYRLAVEQAPAAGTRLHAVAEGGVPFRDIATAIGKNLNVPVVSKSPEESAKSFGWFAHFAAFDLLSSAKKTEESTGWKATHPGLIADIDRPAYYTV